MGSWGARIGKYWMSLHDSEIAYLRQSSKDLSYYINHNVTVDFVIVGDQKNERIEEKLKLPLQSFYQFVFDKKTKRYSIDYENFDLRRALWNLIVSKELTVVIHPYIIAPNHDDPHKSVPYYLRSGMYGDNVSLSNIRPIKGEVLSSYDEILWCEKMCLRYDEE